MASIVGGNGYRKVQRQDKGFDFFDNSGRRINVNQYTQATGINKQSLVQQMAQAGDRVSMNYIARQKNTVTPSTNGLMMKPNAQAPQVNSQALNQIAMDQANKMKTAPKVLSAQGQEEWKQKNTPLAYIDQAKNNTGREQQANKVQLNRLNSTQSDGRRTFDTNLDLYGNTTVNKEIQNYNKSNVYEQRSRLAQLAKDSKSLDDAYDDESARKQAQINLIRQSLELGGKKQAGNLITGVQDFVNGSKEMFTNTGDRLGRMADATVGTTDKLATQYANSANDIRSRYIEARKSGAVNQNNYAGWQSELQRADELERMGQRARGFQIESADPIKAAGAVANAVVLPVSFAAGMGTTGAAAKLGFNQLTRAGISDAATGAISKFAPNVPPKVAQATGLAIENVLAGAPQAAAEVVMNQGANTTAGDILAAQGMNLVGGAAFPVAGAVLGKVAKGIVDSTPDVIAAVQKAMADETGAINLGAIADSFNKVTVDRHPAIQELNSHLKLLRENDEKLAANGLSPNNPARINNKKAQELVLGEINGLRKRISQGGYIKLSNGNEVVRVGKDASKYDMSHRPDADGAPGHDISNNGDFVPSDIYDHPEWYGGNSPTQRKAMEILKSLRGNPDAEVTVYRAAPKDELNISDWVTLTKEYAQSEALSEGVPVHAFKIKAKELRWPGDSLDEFGFFPEKRTLARNISDKNKELGSGGYIKVPGNQADALPESLTSNKQSAPKSSQPESLQQSDIVSSSKNSVSPEESQYINSEAAKYSSEKQFVNDIVERIWAENKKGSGVDTWLREVGPGEGSGYDGRAALTNNSRFYSEYYKEFGKKPTKRDIADMVHDSLSENHSASVKNVLTENEISPLDASIYQELKSRGDWMGRLGDEPNLLPEHRVTSGASSTESSRKPQSPQKAPQEKRSSQPANSVQESPSNQKNPSDQRLGTPDNQPRQNDYSYNNNTTDANIKQYVQGQVKKQQVETKVSLKKRINDWIDEAKHSFVDDAVAYERYVKDKSTRVDLREGVDRVRSSDIIARQFAEDNGMKELGKMGREDLDTFQQYLIAKRSIELEKKGVKTGRDIEADRRLIASVGGKFDSQEALIRNYSNKMLDYSVENGLIAKELAEKLRNDSPDYVPMNRIMDDVESGGFQKTKQLGNLSKQSVVQKIKGSERTVDNPIESLLKNTIRMVNEAERNKVAKTLGATKEFSENLLKSDQKPRAGYDKVSYLEKGQKVSYEVPALVAEEMKNLNGVLPDWASTTIAVLGAPTRLLRTGATSANPVFSVTNMVRDQLQTLITGNSKMGIVGNIATNIKGSPKAFVAAFAPGKAGASLRAELSRNGVIGSEYRMTYGYKSGELIKELERSAKLSKGSLQKIKQPINTLADIIGRTEYFTRAQQFYGTKGSDTVRAQAARNNTLNFSRAGSVTRVLNKVIPFLNAGVQGGRLTVTKFKNQPIATSVSMASLTGVALAIKSVWESSEENKALYDRIGEEEKKNNLVILTPDARYNPESNRVEGVIKIPMPQMVYPFLDAVNNTKGRPEDFARLAGDIFTATTGVDAVNPINQLTPTFAKPFAEAALNKSFYSGNDLVSEYEKNLAPEDKSKKYTSGVARGVAKATGVDAPVVDNFIGAWGGGLAKDVTKGMSDNPDNNKDGGGVLGSMEQGFGRRFSSAGVTSQYDLQAEKAKTYKKLLESNKLFQALSPSDRAKVLDKVDSDTRAIAGISAKTEQNRSDEIKKELSSRQRSIVEGGFDVDKYLKQATSNNSQRVINEKLLASTKSILEKYDNFDEAERKNWFNTENDAEYKYKLAKYENDLANNALSKAQEITQKKALRKDKVGADFTKEVRELYGVSERELGDWLSENDGKTDKAALAERLIAYDRALYDSGVASSLKFRGGIARSGSSRGGGRKSSGSGSYAKLISLASSVNNKLASSAKANISTSKPSAGGSGKVMKKTELRKYTVAKSSAPKISARKA